MAGRSSKLENDVRTYGRVESTFWQSESIRALPEDGRTLALYLLTCPHGNLLGAFRLPTAYASDDLKWEVPRLLAAFDALSGSGFVTRDPNSQWVVIHEFLKWNPWENPNVAKSAEKVFGTVPRGTLKFLVAGALLAFGQHMGEGFTNACRMVTGTLREPFANPNRSEPNQNPPGTEPPGTGGDNAPSEKGARSTGSAAAGQSAPLASPDEGSGSAVAVLDRVAAATTAATLQGPPPLTIEAVVQRLQQVQMRNATSDNQHVRGIAEMLPNDAQLDAALTAARKQRADEASMQPINPGLVKAKLADVMARASPRPPGKLNGKGPPASRHHGIANQDFREGVNADGSF